MWTCLLLLFTPSVRADPTQGLPAVEISVDEPWLVAHESAEVLSLRYGDSAEGVRLQLIAEEDWQVGVSPIHGGRPIQMGHAPMVMPPGPPRRIEVLSQGPDLVVRMSGEPLSEFSRHPEAPDDPVLTWVRLRPRGSSWRIILDGMGRVSIPGAQSSSWTGEAWQVGPSVLLQSNAQQTSSAIGPDGWSFDTSPSAELADPYPRTAWTFTP